MQRHYKNLRIPAYSKFSMCDTCFKTNTKKRKFPNESEKSKLLFIISRLYSLSTARISGIAMAVRIEHHYQCRVERRYLWWKREECSQNPTKCLIIEIDGMDQRKTESPRIADRPKSLDRCEIVKNHVVGVLANGTRFSIVCHQDHWSRGPNLTISILFQVLSKLPRPWPRIFYLQLDNCISENKNKTVFFVLALLIHLNIFDKVCFYFYFGHRVLFCFCFYDII